MKQLNETDSTDYMAAAGCFCLASRQAARKITRLYDLYMQEAEFGSPSSPSCRS
jgi:hypothetical protein